MNHDADFTDEQLLLTTVQAAHVLGIGRTTVYQLMKTGDLRPVHIARSCRISWAELERFVERLESADPPGRAVPAAERRGQRTTAPQGHRPLVAVESSSPDDPAA